MRWRVGLGVLAGLATAAVIALAAVWSSRANRDPPPRSTAVRTTSTAGATTSSSGSTAPTPGATAAVARGRGYVISIPARAGGPVVPAGFLGLSFEFQAVRTYTGSDPRAINPVLVQLIRNLTPGQAPAIRIGGDSTDLSWVPTHGVRPPPYVSYALTPSWLATTAALAHELGAHMTMGLNLAANEPALAAAEARAYLRALGPATVSSLEIGNEPDVYGNIQVLRTLLGAPLFARPRTYDYASWVAQYRAEARALPRHVLSGPAQASGPHPGASVWLNRMTAFLRQDPRVRTLTIHRYPLRNCYVPSDSPEFPSVDNLLSDYSTRQLAASVRPWLRIAHDQHRILRIDEINSVACRGKTGVSNVFASALWAPDALFSLLHAGVDGVNVHTLPHAAYELFAFHHRGGRWQGQVRPVYYGLQLFAQAAPAGSQLLALGQAEAVPSLSAWGTRTAAGTVRVLLINKSQRLDRNIVLRPPAGLAATVTVERMQAASVYATRVTLGTRSYGNETTTGLLPPPRLQLVARRGRGYPVTVSRGSAALVTFTPAS